MTWLRIAMRLVLVQVLLVALSLLGLVLIGTAPAATAAAHVVGPIRRDEHLPLVHTMWQTWRASLVRSNLAAAPAGLLALAAGGNLLLLGGGALGATGPSGPTGLAGAAGLAGLPAFGGAVAALSVLMLAVASLAWLIAVTLVADDELTPLAALRASVLFPLAWPGTTVSMLVTLGAVALLGAIVPVAAALWGGAAIMLVVELLVSTRRQVPDARLAAR